ncbi:MAG: ribonuclease HII [Actinobacteria bacterium]|nr:MAG: ribonuclease HII [Actinomycetota bacterium]
MAIKKNVKSATIASRLSAFDKKILSQGFNYVAGVDEAGRGALAGPLVAASVILPANFYLKGLKECKQLLASQREQMYNKLIKQALCFKVIEISNVKIDKNGLQKANIEALRLAATTLRLSPDFILSDGFALGSLSTASLRIIKGDEVSLSIAAASIIAKVHRDRLMTQYNQLYPNYNFDENKGYGTKAHLQALDEHGPCAIHRRSFKPIKSLQ